MFIIERRTAGVLAALATAGALAILGNVADRAEFAVPSSPSRAIGLSRSQADTRTRNLHSLGSGRSAGPVRKAVVLSLEHGARGGVAGVELTTASADVVYWGDFLLPASRV
jgi:hypothetical protein